MAKYYKVDVRSEYNDLSNKNTQIIIKKIGFFSKEIATSHILVNCDNEFQGGCYDYYVMSTDFKNENIATLEEVKEYLNNFKYEGFPIYTKKEERETTKIIKQLKRKIKGK